MQYCFLFFAEKAFDEGGNVALLFGFDNVVVRRFFRLFNGFLRAVKVCALLSKPILRVKPLLLAEIGARRVLTGCGGGLLAEVFDGRGGSCKARCDYGYNHFVL